MAGGGYRVRMTAGHETVVVTPILKARDLAESAAFYEHLAFTVDIFSDDYAFVTMAGHELLHLATADSPSVAAAYVNVPSVDDWHTRCISAHRTPTAIRHRPWGMREFTVMDPAGNTLRIGTNA